MPDDRPAKDQLDKIFEEFPIFKYKKNQLVYHAGDKLTHIYYLKKGYIRQYAVSEKGEEFIINIFKPGTYFPIIFLNSRKTENPCYFEGITNLEIQKIPAENMLKFIQDNPKLSYDLFLRLSSGIEGMTMRIKSLVFGNSHSKVSAAIYLSALRFGQKNGKSIEIKFPLTHQRIANLIGITRESVSLEMIKLKKTGIIFYKGKTVIVKSIIKLKNSSRFSGNL
jgi:CRP-like cAMP-binding protein